MTVSHGSQITQGGNSVQQGDLSDFPKETAFKLSSEAKIGFSMWTNPS